MEFSIIISILNKIWRPIADFLHPIFYNAFYLVLFIAVIVSVIYYIISINIIFFNKVKKKKYDFEKEKAPFVTVQIPTFNELVAIRCAKSCLEFDYPKDRYEIIIGDDSNKNSISEELDDFARQHELVKITRRGNNIGYKSGNLNHMLKYSKGEIIILFDSDFVPDKDFLKRIVAPFQQDKNIGAVQARWKFLNPNQNLITTLGAVGVSVFHYITLPFIKSRRGIAFICGSAEAVRKDVLIKLGGWKSGALTEDIEYSLRLLKNKYKIEYLSDLGCDSEIPYRAKDLYNQQKRWAYGFVSAFKEHGKDILKSKQLKIKDKFYITLPCIGYLLSGLLFFLFLTGFLSFITQNPGTFNIITSLYEFGRNALLSSGILFASILAQVKKKNIRGIPSMILSSFSYGLVVIYHVNVGIFKVFAKKSMPWFMLHKHGNKITT